MASVKKNDLLYATNNIKKNSFFSFITVSSRLIANVLIFWILARVFDTISFGQFTYAYTLATTFLLFADFGFDILLTTEVAKNRIHAKRIFGNYLSIKLIFTCISLIVMWILILVKQPNLQGTLVAVIFSLFMVFTTITNYFCALFRGMEKLNYESIVSLVSNIGLVIFVLFFVFFRVDNVLISLSFLLGRILGFFVGLKYFKHLFGKVSFKMEFVNFKESFSKTVVFGLIILLSGLLFQMDTVLLGLIKSDYEVGIYQAAVKIIMLPLIIPSILFNAVLPVLARLHLQNEVEWQSLGRFINKFLIWIALPITIILFIYPGQIISMVYGREKFLEAIPILRIFSIIFFIRIFLETYGYMLTSSKRPITQMYILFVAISINLILDLIYIPKYGTYGALYGSLITSAIIALGYCFANSILFVKWVLNYQNIILLFITVACVLFLLKFDKINFFGGVSIVCGIFLFYAWLDYFTSNERKLLISKNFNH